MVYFDNCNITVGSTGILAESVRIRAENSIEPVYALGFRGVLNQVPEGPIRGQINLTYALNLQSEPVFPLINTFKNLTGSYEGITIVAAGITGYNCYLTNYSIKSSPNQIVYAEASFVTFRALSGNLRERITNENGIANFSGYLGNGWSTHILSGTSYLTAPIYNFDYSLSLQWEPNYIFGSALPLQIDLLNMSERMVFVRDTYHHIQFSGEEASRDTNNAYLRKNNSDNEINFLRYDFISDSNATFPSLVISLSGTRIKSSDAELQLDDFAKTITEITKFY